jgi:hypothetical protein
MSEKVLRFDTTDEALDRLIDEEAGWFAFDYKIPGRGYHRGRTKTREDAYRAIRSHLDD